MIFLALLTIIFLASSTVCSYEIAPQKKIPQVCAGFTLDKCFIDKTEVIDIISVSFS